MLLFFKKIFASNKIRNITTEELKEELKYPKNKEFIDVRTRDEFGMNHIRGFKNLPLQTLDNNVEKLDKSKEIIIMCQSGGRSSLASKQLKKLGFENVTNVKGGMSNWRK